MPSHQNSTLLVSIVGEDRLGVISNVTNYLFEIGANLADTAYAMLGKGFEFSCVASFTGLMTVDELKDELQSLEVLKGARITVSTFPFSLERDEKGSISHIIEVMGGDRPGLVARISEVLEGYDANVVRMNSRRLETKSGEIDYRTRFAVFIPEGSAVQCKNALVNTAGSLRLILKVEPV